MTLRKTVIFDLDGTLVDTSRDLIAGANACFEALGLGAVLDAEADAATALRGGRAMLREGLGRADLDWDESTVDREFPNFIRHYEAVIDATSRPFDGAEAAVRRLRHAGYATGICTNKPERLSELLLTRLGLRDLFDSHIGADTLPVRKPDPEPLRQAVLRAGGDPGRAVIIGDTDTDRNTAAAAGIAAVLVTFGPLGESVAELRPEALLHRFEDLGAVVAGLIG
ncbi:HAD-IA family hydrolase [Frigidibacter sp. ROC022]|uniref:HAD-IA family hydrolase n=1 Tax=Frigidibacter sp. ROC022 TaxID=2971796 RepID=UPI00215A1B13|nr:HAD-IA family hydrolase [Frigidibacter sp. ROC022]MCR8725485.1 HAD-IA family hydrolase [Frigidibacter sp. ROC022]